MEWLVLIVVASVGLAWVKRYKPSWWEKINFWK